jgi:hypothetical protein
MFRNRATLDIVVIMLTGTVGLVLIAAVIGVFFLKMYHPELDSARAGEMVGGMLQTIVGALVGFVGGRAAGRAEANGKLNGVTTST